ncbi:MAG: DUF445 family protein [Longimicrobiales bacterium]
MNSIWIQALLTVLVGAIAGGITNAVAVWMLFHPYDPPRLFRWRLRLLQGAIPKNNARLAQSLGRTVGNKLLTSEDLARTVNEPGFREAFEERFSGFLRSFFDERRGSLAELLPPALYSELEVLLNDAGGTLLGRLDAWLASEEFHVTARGWADDLAAEVRDKPLSDVLTPEREQALAQAAEKWISETVGGDGFSVTVRDTIERAADRVLEPGSTFEQMLPIGLIAAVERAIAGYLPIALEKLGGLLEDPEARRRVERVLHELLDRFMRDLRFHQRIVAALIITPETIDKVLIAVEAEGAAKISELLHDPAIRDAMARGVNSAIVDFLQKPVTAVLGKAGDPSVEDAKETVHSWALSLARDPRTHAFLVERLESSLASAERRTWGDLFRHLPPERAADAIVGAARSERARTFYRDTVTRFTQAVLHREIGRIGEHIPADAPARIEKAMLPLIWAWITEQVPQIAQRIDIAAKVENKILEFPMAQIEQLIKGVIERELSLIVRLGYVLGAFIGVISAVIGILAR